jgi:hypothetical protein
MPKKLLDPLCDALRHYGIRTEQSRAKRIKKFIFYRNKKGPLQMEELKGYLTFSDVEQKAVSSARNHALTAVIFRCGESGDYRFLSFLYQK